MSRLFLRFYFGVLLILLVGWFVQNYVSSYGVDEQNARVIERAMAGSLRVARDWLNLRPDNYDEVLPQVQARYEFPVRIHDLDSDQFPEYAQLRLKDHDRIVLYAREGENASVATRLSKTQALSMGPLPAFVQPAQEAWLTGLAIVLLLVAAAIAVLLRPLAAQLRAIEKMATSISGGNLNTRIDPKRVPSGRRLADALNSMADQTQSILRTQRELLQAVSHDLRTPLTKMRFAIDLASSAKTEEERKKRLESLDATTEELDGLVDELLQYVRMETNAPLAIVEEVNVEEILHNVLERRADMHRHLEFDVAVSYDAELWAEPRAIQRVLNNLISNACRYAREQVRITTARDNGYFSLTVEDDGNGIPAADRKRVLQPFVRLQNEEPKAKTSGGVGLGLALVTRILKRHEGDVVIGRSKLGGCRVVTKWPNKRENV